MQPFFPSSNRTYTSKPTAPKPNKYVKCVYCISEKLNKTFKMFIVPTNEGC